MSLKWYNQCNIFRGLEETVISLNPNDPLTQKHIVKVLIILQDQVNAFINFNLIHSSVDWWYKFNKFLFVFVKNYLVKKKNNDSCEFSKAF